jgi:hypothetical protein
MKTTVFSLIMFAFFFLAMQANAQNEFEKDVIGTWKINLKATEKLTKEKKPELGDMPEMLKKIFAGMRLEFQKGGKFKSYNANKDVKGEGAEGTWSLENSILSVKDAKTGKVQNLNIIGVDLMELRLHDVTKNTYMVLELTLE